MKYFVLILCFVQIGAKECPGLGTFEPTGPFVNWPDPYCPAEMGEDFILLMFTRENSTIGEEFTRDNVPSIFDPQRNTVFIVHGWSRDITSQWIHDMKDAWLARTDANIVLVGWGGDFGAQNIRYSESSSTTRTVGAEIAETISGLIQNGGTSGSQVHCIGSSLGAQVCGHTGRWSREQTGHVIGRCTGLDPAGPIFANNTDRTVGIWTDCADFVDIIHTDTVYGSTPEPDQESLTLGHQDFFPNNGMDHPGCNGSNLCGHGMARMYFEASLANDCFVATETCSESNDIPASCTSCGGTCAVMGYAASSAYDSGIYRLDTSDASPYCPSGQRDSDGSVDM